MSIDLVTANLHSTMLSIKSKNNDLEVVQKIYLHSTMLSIKLGQALNLSPSPQLFTFHYVIY